MQGDSRFKGERHKARIEALHFGGGGEGMIAVRAPRESLILRK